MCYFFSFSGSDVVQYPGSFTLGRQLCVFHIMSFHWAHDFLASIQIPFLFFRPLICYRFYSTGLAFIHAYLLPLSPANIGGCGSRCTSKLPQWSHDLEAGWLSSRQKCSPHPMATCTVGLKHPCAEFHGRFLVWCFMDSAQPDVLGIFCLKRSFQPQPLGICLRCLRMRSESVNTDWVWAFPQGQAGILMNFLFKRSSDVMGVWF